MINGIKELFKSIRESKEPQHLPEKGEVWYNKGDDSPWHKKDCEGVTIRDVKDDWFLYDFNCKYGFFQDQRLELDTFLHCYSHYE